MPDTDKNKLIREFQLMAETELSARDFYLKLCKDPSLEKEEKKILNDIANDEQEHIKIVQEIISLINSNL
jgi:rubrerythrin